MISILSGLKTGHRGVFVNDSFIIPPKTAKNRNLECKPYVNNILEGVLSVIRQVIVLLHHPATPSAISFDAFPYLTPGGNSPISNTDILDYGLTGSTASNLGSSPITCAAGKAMTLHIVVFRFTKFGNCPFLTENHVSQEFNGFWLQVVRQ